MLQGTSSPIESAVISVRGFQKSYETAIAVTDLSFNVNPGQILGMVGPNGAGKTTTMRAIAGIIPPSGGQLAVAGHAVIDDAVAAKRVLAYVPDDPKLFEALTVWEHLEFIASAYDVPNFQPEAQRLLEQFELTEKRNALAQELSRGMRQKVAIACAYLHQPRAILLDEPLTGLDPRGIRTMKQTIRERAASGSGIVISSHLLSLVEDLCTDLLVMLRGQRRFFGSISEARSIMADADGASTLEDVFFRMTEDEAGDPKPLVEPS